LIKNIFRHPYLYTGILFFIIAGSGSILHWPQAYYAFLLLLYFIVAIGIKLDDISRQIAATRYHTPELMRDADTIIKQLGEIHTTLSATHAIDKPATKDASRDP